MLKITVMRAEIFRNTRMMSTMDPYCKVVYGEKSELTEVHKDAGKKPEWDQAFQFEYDPDTVSVMFLVYDKDGSKDNFIGNYSLNVSQFFDEPFADEVNLNKSGTHNGKLFLKAWIDKPEAEEVKPPPVYIIQHQAPAAPAAPMMMPPPQAPAPPQYVSPPPLAGPGGYPPPQQGMYPPPMQAPMAHHMAPMHAPMPMAAPPAAPAPMGQGQTDNSWLTNLTYFKRPMWFRNNSAEIKEFNFQVGQWVDAANFNNMTLHQSFNTQQLPDGSYIIVGGIEGGVYTNKTLHYYQGYYYPKNPMKYPKTGHCTAFRTGSVWVMGGFMGQVINMVEVLDLHTGTWNDGPPLTIARTDASACMIDSDSLYIFGGQNPNNPMGAILNSIEHLNFNTGLWMLFAIPMPSGLLSPVVAQISPSQILVLGGNNGADDVAEVKMFVRSTGEWMNCSDLETPTRSIMECYYNNQQVHVFGGTTLPSDEPPLHVTYPLQIVFQ